MRTSGRTLCTVDSMVLYSSNLVLTIARLVCTVDSMALYSSNVVLTSGRMVCTAASMALYSSNLAMFKKSLKPGQQGKQWCVTLITITLIL